MHYSRIVWTFRIIARKCAISLSERRDREGGKTYALRLEKKLRTYEMLPKAYALPN